MVFGKTLQSRGTFGITQKLHYERVQEGQQLVFTEEGCKAQRGGHP